jgi:hypothetical protein
MSHNRTLTARKYGGQALTLEAQHTSDGVDAGVNQIEPFDSEPMPDGVAANSSTDELLPADDGVLAFGKLGDQHIGMHRIMCAARD